MITLYLQAVRLFSRDIRLFLVATTLVALAWDGVRAVLFNLYLLRLGYGPEFVGLVNAVAAYAFALLCLPAGSFGTRWGSRNMLIIGLGVLAAGLGLLPLAEFVPPDWRSAWLLATAVLSFLGFALYLVNGLPFMMGATGSRERNYVFSIHVALLPLAAFFGSLLGGAAPGAFASLLGISVEEAAAYRYPLWLAALVLLPGLLALLRTQPAGGQPVETAQADEVDVPAARADRPPYALFVAIAVAMALRFGGRGTVTTFFNVYLDDGLGISPALIGALIAGAQIVSVPSALLAPLLAPRLGNARIFFLGTLGTALATLPLVMVPHWAGAGFGYISSSIFFYVSVGPMRVFSQELVTPRWRATMASAFMLGAGMAFATMSLIGGYVIAALGYRVLFLLGIGLMVAGGLFFWTCFRVPRGEMAGQASSGLVD